MSKEVNVVDPETGGQKGSKEARFDLIPPEFTWALAEHYGRGEQKYPTGEDNVPNWQKGYSWRLSVAALQRHFHQWLQGEDYDAETGSHHLIAVAWHAAALFWFQKHGKGRDFRNAAQRKPIFTAPGEPLPSCPPIADRIFCALCCDPISEGEPRTRLNGAEVHGDCANAQRSSKPSLPAPSPAIADDEGIPF